MQSILPWHQEISQYIKRLILNKTLPHAIMIRERTGFYDNDLANSIGKIILCDNNTAGDNCKHCNFIEKQNHPNLVYLDAAEKVSIDDIRKLEQQIWQTATFDKPKIIHLRYIDLLSINAQNALLKTLEEPPKNIFFIITILNKHDVIPTIISRVQYLQHKPTNSEDIVLWLQAKIDNNLNMLEVNNIAKIVNYVPEKSLNLLQDNNQMELLKIDKNNFAKFMTGKLSSIEFTDKVIKTNDIESSLTAYIGYIDLIIKDIFKKNLSNNQNDNFVSYNSWNNINQKDIFKLRDILHKVVFLNKKNVNISLQMKQLLMEWNDDR